MKLCILFLSALVLLVAGCAPQMNIQLEGRPVPNYVNRASLINSGITVETALIRYFGQKEGDELLSTYEYLELGTEKPHKIKMEDTQRLKVMVLVNNPNREYYALWIDYAINKDDGVSLSRQAQEPSYEGKLSRKEFDFALPLQKGIYGFVRFTIFDKNFNIIYESPKASYVVVSTRESSYDKGFQVK